MRLWLRRGRQCRYVLVIGVRLQPSLTKGNTRLHNLTESKTQSYKTLQIRHLSDTHPARGRGVVDTLVTSLGAAALIAGICGALAPGGMKGSFREVLR